VIRSALYVLASGVVWLVEGFLFSRLLALAAWQTGLLLFLYLALFAVAVAAFVRAAKRQPVSPEGVAHWRSLALAPMLVAVLGSFVSLPLVLLIALLGKLTS